MKILRVILLSMSFSLVVSCGGDGGGGSDFSANGTWCWMGKSQFGNNDFHISDSTMLIRTNGNAMSPGSNFSAKRDGEFVHFTYTVGEIQVKDTFKYVNDNELVFREKLVDGTLDTTAQAARSMLVVRCP